MTSQSSRRRIRFALAGLGSVLLTIGVLVPLAATEALATVQTYYAAPSGSGTDCTQTAPCSLSGVRDKVRTLTSTMTDDINIDLRGGTYHLAGTFALTTQDSGMNGHKVVWQAHPGEKPVFSGAGQVTSWQPYDTAKNIYRAPIAAGTQSRQLYVNGVRAVRARSTLNPSGFTVTSTGFTTSDPQYRSWSNPGSIEIVGRNAWKELRCPVTSITANGSGSAFTLAQPCFGNGGSPPYPDSYFPYNGGGSPGLTSVSWIENAYQLLDTPGEFYLDSAAGYVYYIPRTGENLSIADVEVPTVETLVSLTGTPGHLVPVNDTDSSIKYTDSSGNSPGSWFSNDKRPYGDLGDDVHAATTSGDKATITFTGTGIEVLSEANSDEGNIDVSVDGTFDSTVSANRAAERLAQQVIFSRTGLSQGTHTIELKKKDGQYLLIDGYVPITAPIAPVHDIVLRGITFSYATWLAPSGPNGYRDNQAGVTWTGSPAVAGRTPGAVRIARGQRVEVSDGEFSHLGGSGADLADGTQDSTVTGNRIYDTSGSGVSVGEFDDFWLANTALMTSGDTVNDNAISYVGQEYEDAVGILVGDSRSVTLTHNEIAHTPYSGISFGWGWGWASTNGGLRHGTLYSRGNNISNNYVHDVMKVLDDGGLIYTNGGQGDGSVHSTFSGNVLSTCTSASGGGGQGMYLDEGSSWWDAGGNVVSQTAYDWTKEWTNTIHDINVHDNYSDTTQYENHGTNVTITNTTYVTNGVWPTGAQSIVAAAGLEPAYKALAAPQAYLGNDGAFGNLLSPATIAYTGSWSVSAQRSFGDLDEDVHYTQTNGDAVAFTFTGTGIRVLGEINGDQGSLAVTRDGVSAGTVSTSTTGARQVQQPMYQVTNLPYGSHTVTLTKQSGTYATIDGYLLDRTIDDTDATLSYAGSWNVSTGRGLGDYGDGVHYTATNGDSVTATWSGTGVDVVTEKNSDEGNIDVYIDGQYDQTVNATSPTRLSQQIVYHIDGLTPGLHSIRLVKKDGQYLLVDRFTFR